DPPNSTASTPTVTSTPLLPTDPTFKDDEEVLNQGCHYVFVMQDYVATFEHAPGMEDEVELRVGDWVFVERAFSDGWALGRNQTSGHVGMFPLNCVVQVTTSSPITSIPNPATTKSEESVEESVGERLTSIPSWVWPQAGSLPGERRASLLRGK
ncbi:hypothetical protein HK102_008987, partial [Quaeritorhiza haematococci]